LTLDPYQTHQPLLFACAARARGDIIELGCGVHSTLQLEAICHGSFLSYETNAQWGEAMRQYGARRILTVDSYDDVPVRPYTLVFIDNAPAERRKIDLARFTESDMVVIHDSDEKSYGLAESLALYAHRFDHKAFTPHTTLVSQDAETVRRIRMALA
jgi:hypothetical protein